MNTILRNFLLISIILLTTLLYGADKSIEFIPNPLNQKYFYKSESKLFGFTLLNSGNVTITLCGNYFSSILNRLPDGSTRILYTGEQNHYRPASSIWSFNDDQLQFQNCKICDLNSKDQILILKPGMRHIFGFKNIWLEPGEYTYYFKRPLIDGDTVTGKFDFKVLPDEKNKLDSTLKFIQGINDNKKDAIGILKSYIDTCKSNPYVGMIKGTFFTELINEENKDQTNLVLSIIDNIEFENVLKNDNLSYIYVYFKSFLILYKKENKWYKNNKQIKMATQKLFFHLKNVNVNLPILFAIYCNPIIDFKTKDCQNPQYMARHYKYLIKDNIQ